jgi:hypothetical protein
MNMVWHVPVRLPLLFVFADIFRCIGWSLITSIVPDHEILILVLERLDWFIYHHDEPWSYPFEKLTFFRCWFTIYSQSRRIKPSVNTAA